MEKGEKTMRRHVETQIENPERESSGIIILLVMWVLALLALSSAARGEEKQQAPAPAIEAQKPTEGRDGAQHRLQTTPQKKSKPSDNTDSQAAAQPDSSNQITLSR